MIDSALFNASIILLIASAMTLWYSSSRLLLLHLAAITILPAYIAADVVAWRGDEALRLPDGSFAPTTLGAIAVGVTLTMGFAVALFATCFRTGLTVGALSRFGVRGPIDGVLAGIALNVVIVSLITLRYGAQVRAVDAGPIMGRYSVAGTDLGALTLIAVVLSGGAFALVAVVLRATTLGRRVRASAANPSAAAAFGFRDRTPRLFCHALGVLLAALGGVLISFDYGLTPEAAFPWVLYGITAMVVAGSNLDRGWWPALPLTAALIASFVALATWYAGAAWAQAITVVLLILQLRFRPSGMGGVFGRWNMRSTS